MPEITAAAVKSLRERTNLPMMKCKEALTKAGGDADKAVEILRKEGEKFRESRGERETSFGRIEICASLAKGRGAMIELQCESAPVAGNENFRKLAADLAQQLAEGPGAKTPEELLKQPSPSRKGMTLQNQFDELTNQIREVFRLARIVRVNSPSGGYAHHDGSKGVLIEVQGGSNDELVKEFGMQIVAMRPDVVAIEDLDPAVVAKEKEILSEAARKEGKPENIIDKMVEGRLRNFYAERVLNEQPFVKDDKTTVGKLAKSAGMKIVRFHYWVLGGK
jgi:elongation factor Ts